MHPSSAVPENSAGMLRTSPGTIVDNGRHFFMKSHLPMFPTFNIFLCPLRKFPRQFLLPFPEPLSSIN